jgi:hypothetical protein
VTLKKPWTNPQKGKPCAFCGEPFNDDFNVQAHVQTVFKGIDEDGDIDVVRGSVVLYTHEICGMPDTWRDHRPRPGTPIPECGH